MSLDRRDFLKISLTSSLAYVSVNPLAQAFAQTRSRSISGAAASPLRPVSGGFTNSNFNGDEYTRPHNLLWDIPNYVRSKGGRPAVSERREVVIAGGGVSGLCSAYFLQNRDVLLLEQGTQFGGNSKGEVFEGLPFSIGAAYITVPEQGSSLHRLLQTTGVLPAARHEKESDVKVMMAGAGFKKLLEAETNPAAQAVIQRISRDMARINQTAYPTIPWRPGGISRSGLEQLDRMSFAQWLQQNYGREIPAILLEYFQLYCWSSFGGSLDEISAAQALNFLVAETEGVVSFPGGNSYVTQSLFQYLARTLRPDSLRSGAIVLEVKTTSEGVEVLYENAQGELKVVQARACVMAAPKNIAYYLVPEMTAAQKRLAQSIRYRAYIVANVLLNGPVASPCFDAFRLEGQVPPTPRFGHPPKRPYADVIFANWAQGDRGQKSILTLYKPLPFEGARNTIYDGPAFANIRKEISSSLDELMQTLRIPPSAVAGLRLTRWGHSLPLSSPGFFGARQDEIFKTPTQGRIFYVNQDNDINPSFEAAFDNAEMMADSIAKMR